MPRSDQAAAPVISDLFGCEVVPLRLIDPRFYHMDTCLCPLTGGEVLYYPNAFDSAGQRCSALRILCLQEDIAERVLTMLRGAMHELRLGDPMQLSTDVGPVITHRARVVITAHIETMRAQGKAVMQL